MGNAWKVPKVLDITTWRELTEAFISISDRYIYSKTRSAEIQETFQKCAGSLRYGLNAFMPIGIKLPHGETGPASTFLFGSRVKMEFRGTGEFGVGVHKTYLQSVR